VSDTWHQRRLAAARKTPIIKLSHRHTDALGGGRHDRQPQGVKTYFWRHLYINTIFLPRQARDKHRETSKGVRFEYKFDLSSSTKGLSRKHLYEGLKVRRRHFLSTFSIEKIILPRQALGTKIGKTPPKVPFSCRDRSSATTSTTSVCFIFGIPLLRFLLLLCCIGNETAVALPRQAQDRFCCEKHCELVLLGDYFYPGRLRLLKRAYFEFSLCLSQACLGKMMHFIYKWLKKPVFFSWQTASSATRSMK
jgi:hypothetical protein